MSWSQALRRDLATHARSWAKTNGIDHYESLGDEPTVLFAPTIDRRSHGNFQDDAWQAITQNADWNRRLAKPHSQKRALPEKEGAAANELDSSNSSDALLMNCFCFPGFSDTFARSAGQVPSTPTFGFLAELELLDGTRDATEIDMKLGGVLVEAKLTESDFTRRPEPHVLRYSGLERCFDLDSLPRESGEITGYQLIRNVLAAEQHGARLLVLIDQRRPDLLQEWWRVHGSIRNTDLRLRCGFRTWQEIAAASPRVLREFLHAKYGL